MKRKLIEAIIVFSIGVSILSASYLYCNYLAIKNKFQDCQRQLKAVQELSKLQMEANGVCQDKLYHREVKGK
jgi:hypothetical protein